MTLKIFILFVVMISGILIFFGLGAGENPNSYLRRHPAIIKALLLGYVAFTSCFAFPISSEPFPIDISKAYLLIGSCVIMGEGFALIYGKTKEKMVYLLTLLFTVVGMLCRYVLEYGEVSNTYNFTWINIAAYVAIIPVFTAISYHYLSKKVFTSKK